MAMIDSALRRLTSSKRLRAADWAVASLIGARDSASLSKVRTTRTAAPQSAVMPIRKWKAKQIAR